MRRLSRYFLCTLAAVSLLTACDDIKEDVLLVTLIDASGSGKVITRGRVEVSGSLEDDFASLAIPFDFTLMVKGSSFMFIKSDFAQDCSMTIYMNGFRKEVQSCMISGNDLVVELTPN